MNQLKTARLRNTLLVLAAGLVILAGQAAAQEKLGDLVSEVGFDWMVGKWVAETDEGRKYEIVYKWQLNKHVVTVHFKGGDYEHLGMIFYVAAEDRVIQIGVDNRGGSSRGGWEAEGDKAIHKIEHTRAGGETSRITIVHSRGDANTMKAAIYNVEETGELAEEPWGTLEYKRQKEQPGKKCCG